MSSFRSAVSSVNHSFIYNPSQESSAQDQGTYSQIWDSTKQTIQKIALHAISFFIWIIRSVVTGVVHLAHYIGSKSLSPLELVIRLGIYAQKKILCQPVTKELLFDSGYSFTKTPLPQEMGPEALKYACLYGSVHTDKEHWLPVGCTVIARFVDRGLKMVLIEEADTLHVIFGAKGAQGTRHLGATQITDGIINLLGVMPDVYLRAEELYLRPEVQEIIQNTNKKIALSGQCFGASLSAFVALRNNQKAFCINSLAFGAETQWRIGRENLRRANDLVTNVSTSGDFASAPIFPLPLLDMIINLIGIKTPGNFGKHYVFPHPPEYNWDIEAIHTLFLTSIIKFVYSNAPVYTRETTKDAMRFLRTQGILSFPDNAEL